MRTALFLFSGLLLPLYAVGADVYRSPANNGLPAPRAALPQDGTPVALNIFISDGDAASDPDPAGACTASADGEEVCGYDVTVVASGGVTIIDFVPEATVRHRLDGAVSLLANGLNAVDPVPGPVRIGTLTVAASAPGSLDLVAGEYVDAVLQVQPLGPVQLATTGDDSDGDRVLDTDDNCTLHANPDQRDTNADGYGNVCDPDLDNNGAVNFIDLSQMKAVFFTTDADADLNGNGGVSFDDLVVMKQFFFLAPGPSAVAGGRASAGGAP